MEASCGLSRPQLCQLTCCHFFAQTTVETLNKSKGIVPFKQTSGGLAYFINRDEKAEDIADISMLLFPRRCTMHNKEMVP